MRAKQILTMKSTQAHCTRIITMSFTFRTNKVQLSTVLLLMVASNCSQKTFQPKIFPLKVGILILGSFTLHVDITVAPLDANEDLSSLLTARSLTFAYEFATALLHVHVRPVHILPRNNKRKITKTFQKHVLKITAELTHLKSSVVAQSLIQGGIFFIQKRKGFGYLYKI